MKRIRLLLFFLAIGWLSAGFAAEYSNYDVSIKKGTRGKRSGDISKFYYALPDHDLLALKINLEPKSNANAQSWPSATRLEVANIWAEIPAKFGGKPNCKKYLKSLGKD